MEICEQTGYCCGQRLEVLRCKQGVLQRRVESWVFAILSVARLEMSLEMEFKTQVASHKLQNSSNRPLL